VRNPQRPWKFNRYKQKGIFNIIES